MAKAPADLRSLARSHTELALRTLAGIAQHSENDGARVAACIHILDRGWGKAVQTHAGENGDGAIRVLVRHIVNGQDVEAPVIDITPRVALVDGGSDG
jgi:hypothetical protein